jgi:hypothetical protein
MLGSSEDFKTDDITMTEVYERRRNHIASSYNSHSWELTQGPIKKKNPTLLPSEGSASNDEGSSTKPHLLKVSLSQHHHTED